MLPEFILLIVDRSLRGQTALLCLAALPAHEQLALMTFARDWRRWWRSTVWS